jgi:ribosomal protein S18 acetylase RimI-like enzyme
LPSSFTNRILDYSLREATPADAPGIAHVHAASWRTTYQGIVAEDPLAGLSQERRQQGWYEALVNPNPGTCLFVAEGVEAIIGFTSAGPGREGSDPCRGEVHAIYLLEHVQGLGVGRALMRAACAHLVQQGCTSMLLWVLKDNLPARKFYEALGGKTLGEKPIEIGTQTLIEISYGWDDLHIFTKE